MFSVNVRADNDGGHLRIKKNNDVISKMTVTSDQGWVTPSGSAVIHLVPGDQVKVTGEDSNTAKIFIDYKGFSGIQVDTD